MSEAKIFVVEDDPMYAKMLEYVLQMNPDHEVHVYKSGKECIDNLKLQPQVITLDYTLPDMDGTQVLKRIRSFNPNIQVIILSGQQDVATAVGLLKEGAYDYIIKDEDAKQRLINTVHHIRNNQELKNEVVRLREELSNQYDFHTLIKGSSSAMQRIFKMLGKAIESNINVSISGETGTGKELIAKAVHYNSPRKKEPFIAVNVAAIPADLIESEIFGHEKGSFTGAHTRRIGKFEEAGRGTIFLDEIGEMSLDMQAKLLRALQEYEFNRVGGNQVVKLQARVVTATHRDLLAEVEKGNFREDLYYRIIGLPITLPPLRERGNDIILLADFFVQDYCRQNKMDKIALSKSAKEKLMAYPWPGNIRELKAVVELAAVMADGDEIEADDIQLNRVTKLSGIMMEEMTLKDYSNKIIHHFLDKYDDNVILVAEKLDIGKSTIYRMLKEEKELVQVN